jgi:hypothetical protein
MHKIAAIDHPASRDTFSLEDAFFRALRTTVGSGGARFMQPLVSCMSQKMNAERQDGGCQREQVSGLGLPEAKNLRGMAIMAIVHSIISPLDNSKSVTAAYQLTVSHTTAAPSSRHTAGLAPLCARFPAPRPGPQPRLPPSAPRLPVQSVPPVPRPARRPGVAPPPREQLCVPQHVHPGRR